VGDLRRALHQGVGSNLPLLVPDLNDPPPLQDVEDDVDGGDVLLEGFAGRKGDVDHLGRFRIADHPRIEPVGVWRPIGLLHLDDLHLFSLHESYRNLLRNLLRSLFESSTYILVEMDLVSRILASVRGG